VIHDDDKTVEILVPSQITSTPSSGEAQELSSRISSAQLNRRRTDPKSSTAALAHRSWLKLLQQEWQEDWTLRVLAALTILALSLLVL